MRTGPLLAALKARVLAAVSNRKPKVDETLVNTPTEAEPPKPTELTQPAQPILTSHSSDHQSHLQLLEGASDGVPDTSALPAPPDLMPLVTSDMSVDEEDPPTITAASHTPCNSVIQVSINPDLGFSALVQTPLPALLFVDKDEHPSWLLMSITDHLQHSPYCLCFSK